MIWLFIGIITAIATLFIASTKSTPAHGEQRYAKKAVARRTFEKEQQLKEHFPVRYSLRQLQKTITLRTPVWTKGQYERITTFLKDVQLLIDDPQAELLIEPHVVALAQYTSPLNKEQLLARVTLCEEAISLVRAYQLAQPIPSYSQELEELATLAKRYYTNEKSVR